jgi:superfamily II DNA or RNA helicase
LRLEDILSGVQIGGLAAEGLAVVKSVEWFGEDAVEVVFEDAAGRLAKRLLYRHDEVRLEAVKEGLPWSFDGDGRLLRLVSEAYRISLAHLFDPFLALSTAHIEPYPHQLSAVYEHLLPRQPLRFLLADDPGAGKTIMAGLYIRELMARADLERCLIVAPGSLTEQWQDELDEKFHLSFDLMSRERIETSRTGNPFEDHDRIIARLDQLSRNEEVQDKIRAAPDWDLVVVDEAHKMSAHYQSGRIKDTKRYGLGQLLGKKCRHLLLMTATPHSGKEEDFQLFLRLLDEDRYEGKFRDGVHTTDAKDIMRRLVKEDLLKFDYTPLFPERKSYTAQYELSLDEGNLYSQVTDYVREEMNRADKLLAQDGARRSSVGFALQTLQRRLASSPEAILRSIERRRERLEGRLGELKTMLRTGKTAASEQPSLDLSGEDLDDLYEELPDDEIEELENQFLDHATAAQTVEELQAEILILGQLENLARQVRRSGQDSKWNQLNSILDHPLMIGRDGSRTKLVVFTEFRDTLHYLAERIRTRLGRPEAVVEIHGGVKRKDRRKRIHEFMNDPLVLVMVANDAAGEGVNLQRAHLMVNYDLPWNPNRLEQRFGRIHRIGQDEVCHLWNLVAKDTREGDVYERLLSKLEQESESLKGKVFDVLGQLFDQKPLRELLIEAIRYGNDPEVRARLHKAVDDAADHQHLLDLVDSKALAADTMDTTKVRRIRQEMERAHAHRLQPHFIQSFFIEAFQRLGGEVHPREKGRFEITRVPAALRERERKLGCGAPLAERYERICFEKDHVGESPRAELVCPGHRLLDNTIDLLLERHRDLLKRGAILVDVHDEGLEPSLLLYLEHHVQDGRRTRSGDLEVVSKRLQFIRATRDGRFFEAGAAPYLDLEPASEADTRRVLETLDEDWLRRDWDRRAVGFAVERIVPDHVREVKERRLPFIDKVEHEVRARLQKEINHWERQAQELKEKERAGKKTRLPASMAQGEADKLAERMKIRLLDLDKERSIMPGAPLVRGGALVVPVGLIKKLKGVGEVTEEKARATADERRRIEMLAMNAVMAAEKALGREPRDVSESRGLGYDIESVDKDGRLVFVEVKGRCKDADSVTLTRNEILRALNEPEKFRLAIVLVDGDQTDPPLYVRGFYYGDPVFEQTSSTYNLSSLVRAAGEPT